MGDVIVYETKGKWRPYLLVDDNGYVSFDKFIPYTEVKDGEVSTICYRKDTDKEKLLIDAIMRRMNKLGVDPDNKYKVVAISKEGYPVHSAKTIEQFINGSLRHYVYDKGSFMTFERMIWAIDYEMPDKSFLCKQEDFSIEDFVLTVNKPVFRRTYDNKNTKTFDFIDIEMVIRSTDVSKKKVKEHKEEIFNKATYKLETSRQFQKYGVPINFLKMYQFVLRHDGTIIVSFCLKHPITKEYIDNLNGGQGN